MKIGDTVRRKDIGTVGVVVYIWPNGQFPIKVEWKFGSVGLSWCRENQLEVINEK